MTRESLPGINVELPSLEEDIADAVCEPAVEASDADKPATAAETAALAEPEAPKPARPRRGSQEVLAAEARSRPRPVTLDAAQQARLMADLWAEQSLVMGLVGGTLAAVVGAILWATVTVGTSFQIGWMAVAVGFLVGRSMGVLGKGIDRTFGYAGAILALTGCLAGNLLSVCVVVAQQQELALSYVLSHLNPAAIPELLAVTLHPMDLLFYGLAVYEGYRFAFRSVTPTDLVPVSER